MKNIIDTLFNSSLKEKVLVPDSFICLGQKGSGKSTLFSFISRQYKALGYNLISSYPMQDCFQIPLTKNNRGLIVPDKQWLFNSNLDNSVIFIDEASDLWPSREYSRGWTVEDQNFFTKSRKHKIILALATQYYDLIDINCKRSCEYLFFLTRSNHFENFSHVAISELVEAPVGDLNTRIIAKGMRDAYSVHYSLCEIPRGDVNFYRKPYYKYFSTYFDFQEKQKVNWEDVPSWNDFLGVVPNAKETVIYNE